MNASFQRLRRQLRGNRRMWMWSRLLVVLGILSFALWVVFLVFGHESTGERVINLLIAIFVLALGTVALLFLRSGGTEADAEPPALPKPTPQQITRAKRMLIGYVAAIVAIAAGLIIAGLLAGILPLVLIGGVILAVHLLVFLRLYWLFRRRHTTNEAA